MTCLTLLYCYRQELVKRNALDLPEERINHRNMLERLMKEIVTEESIRAQALADAATKDNLLKIEEAKKIREQRKLEALERSRQRQLNPEYFQQKASMNEEAKLPKPPTSASDIAEVENHDSEEDAFEQEVDNDPFRSYKTSGQRNKLFVR
jgi:hypothetical protein